MLASFCFPLGISLYLLFASRLEASIYTCLPAESIFGMPAVGPRVSKEEFMQALGLNSHDPQHEQYYRAMRVCLSLLPVYP
jgi:hypothetical protein